MNRSDNLNLEQRTLGDGMDGFLLDVFTSLNQKIPQTTKSVTPNGPIRTLTPKYVPKERKQTKLLLRKQKDPKFIPYEPYKAAVLPIMPRKKIVLKIETPHKNNVDIHNLVSQMSEMRQHELNKAKIEAYRNDDVLIPRQQWEAEKTALETDIKNLKESNAHLENQLKFQAQVNSELKTLLVAAVGEDLESRVQHLTEDKLQLARALLKSANHLTSHQEQTEWLSGQCEVWRSKFLASRLGSTRTYLFAVTALFMSVTLSSLLTYVICCSLMVEELARWKSALTTTVSDLQDCVKCLLDERNKIYNKSLKTCFALSEVLESLNSLNEQLSNDLKSLLNVDKQDRVLRELLSSLPKHTLAEKNALQILKNPVVIPNKSDVICNALMGAATSLKGGQMYLQNPSLQSSCCPHCRGEVQEI